MPTSPEDLRGVRHSYSVAYLQILKSHSRDSETLFACVEGLDGSYFKTRINGWMVHQGCERKLLLLNCGGKEEVLRVRRAADANATLREAFIIYIVDRDFGDAEETNGRDDTFVTQGYAVENYYIGEDVARRIIEEHVFQDRIAGDDEDTIQELLDTYCEAENDYLLAVNPFNEWVAALRGRGGKRVSLEKFDTSTFIKVNLAGARPFVELCPTKADFDATAELNADPVREEELEVVRERLDLLDGRARYRGKQHAIFMINVMAAFGLKARKGEAPFSEARKHTIPCSLKAFVREWSTAANHCGLLYAFLETYFSSRPLNPVLV